jgi:hypothetical protein
MAGVPNAQEGVQHTWPVPRPPQGTIKLTAKLCLPPHAVPHTSCFSVLLNAYCYSITQTSFRSVRSFPVQTASLPASLSVALSKTAPAHAHSMSLKKGQCHPLSTAADESCSKQTLL